MIAVARPADTAPAMTVIVIGARLAVVIMTRTAAAMADLPRVLVPRLMTTLLLAGVALKTRIVGTTHLPTHMSTAMVDHPTTDLLHGTIPRETPVMPIMIVEAVTGNSHLL